MLPRKDDRWITWLAVMIIAVIVGYYLGILAHYGIDSNGALNMDGIQKGADILSSSPMLWMWTSKTLPSIALACAVGGFWCLLDWSKPNKYRTNREYGSAVWADVKKLAKKLEDKKNTSANRILTQHVRISYNTKFTQLNNNGVVIGGSGSSKTFRHVSPNLYHCYGTVCCTDPKGELMARHGAHLQKEGYRVVVLNLIEPDKSDRYNPFVYIRSQEDLAKLAHNFMENTADKKAARGDAFWTDCSESLLTALFYYVWMEMDPDKKNLISVIDLLDKAKVDDNGAPSELDIMMDRLPDGHPAKIQYGKVFVGAADTIRSVLITLQSRTRSLTSPKIKRLFEADDIKIAEMGIGQNGDRQTKTALFLVIPDSDKTFNYIIGLMYTQLFQELYFQADMVFDGSLPIPVNIWMDEFANVSLPDDFTSLESTMRSRGISVQIILQNLAQLKELFEKSWETVIGNADTLLFLGGNEESTQEYISKKLGNETIDKKSNSESIGGKGGGSISHDRMQRALLTPDEVGRLDKRLCLLFIRGENPVIDRKYETLKDKVFMLFGGMRYKHNVLIKRDRQGNIVEAHTYEEPKLVPLSAASYEYYKRAEESGENVVTYDLSLDDFLLMDLSAGIPVEFRSKYMTEDPDYSAQPEKYLQQSQKEKSLAGQLLNQIILSFSPQHQAEIMNALGAGLTMEELQFVCNDASISLENLRKKLQLAVALHKRAVGGGAG